MTQRALVSPHDAFGTNLYGHVLRGRMMRMVPRENEEINETWIADRDRFGFEGMYSPDRATQPMVRVGGVLQPVDWEVALTAAAEGLQKASAAHGAASLGFLSSPSATVEEMFLLSQVARGLGTHNVDHRLRQLDFRADGDEAAFPSLGLAIADVEVLEGVLVIGANLRHEMPLLAHRIRKAAVSRGAKVAFLNPRKFDYLFPVAGYGADPDLIGGLASVVRATAAAAGKAVPSGVREAAVSDTHRSLAAALGHGQRHAIFLGALAQRHPAYAEIRSLAGALAQLSGASLGLITDGANSAGGYLAGAVPHREAGGTAVAAPGLAARAMLENRLKAYVLFGGIDPANDLAGATDALASADFVIAATTHLTDKLREVAHVVLPVGTFAESAGTFVNVEGRWQSWTGAASPVGESRPGWKVLRVLANLLNIRGVDYMSSEEVREAVKNLCGPRLAPSANVAGPEAAGSDGAKAAGAGAGGGATPSGQWVDIPPYQIDVLVRGSESLAKTKDGQAARAVL
jgi:NADH-quinone oxidoreductase subunit G